MRAVAFTFYLSVLLSLSSQVAANVDKIFGLSEDVYIEELDVTLPAKIDTGAESVSINAINIRLEKSRDKDSEDKVHFDLVMPDNSLKTVTLPLSKHIRIKRRASDYGEEEKDYARRPVVELNLCIGGHTRRVEVNLADRRQFSKPVLVGHNPLQQFNALVDSSAEYLQDVARCKSAAADTGNKDENQ